MGSYCSSYFDWKLEYSSSCSSQEVLPMDWVNVGCPTVSVAGVFLSPEASVVGIVELDKESFDGVPRHLHINQHSSAAVCQSIESVHIVDKYHFTSNLKLEYSEEWSVLNAAGIVCLERFHSSAGVFGLDGEQLTVDLFQFAVVSGIYLGIGAVDVEGVVEDGVGLWSDSRLEQSDIFLCVKPCSDSLPFH